MPALPVVVPLLMAAVLVAIGTYFPRRLLDLISLLTAGAVAGICGYMTFKSAAGSPIVYWFGNWIPQKQFALGISFVIDPIGGGMATLVALMVCASFLFSWYYFESIKSFYHALMLVFLAGMCGLCLTGDLFNLFVWFEVMSAAGVTLCGYKSEEYGPLQGALNFAVLNTLGAYLSLTGIALVYGHVGALNMAQVSQALISHPAGGFLVPVAFLFILAGFVVKAAAFPFHFWLADAHAVAPTPVCVLFSGVMVELGIYAAARIYWSVFEPALDAHQSPIRALFLTMGVLTAVVGALQCFTQRHLKRLLAFSTISHVGLMIIGFALLDSDALAGVALYVVGHGMVKGALFITVGILLHRFQSVDEFELQGKGKRIPWTGVLMLLGAIGLCSLPPFANYSGESMIDEAAEKMGLGWLSGVFIFAGALTAGAVLRICARVFVGWGQRDDEALARYSKKADLGPETQGGRGRVPWTMWTPACLLLLGAMCVSGSGAFRAAVRRHADRMEQTAGYNALVLEGKPLLANPQIKPKEYDSSIWMQVLALGVAAGLALLALFPKALGEAQLLVGSAIGNLLAPLKAIHTGRVGDYVAWFLFGIAGYGIFLLIHNR